MKKYFFFPLLVLLAVSYSSFGQYHVGTGGSKYVLLEQAMGAWGGFNPDGYQNVMQTIMPTYPRTIVADWHNGDPMQLTGDPFCTGSGYITAFPSATIDRMWRDSMVGQIRPYDSFVDMRYVLTPNFDVDMYTTYNPTTQLLTVTVTGTALTNLTGNWNLNAYVLEDSISSGTASGYNQVNYAGSHYTTSCTGSPSWYLTAGSPISPYSLYPHNNVVRAVLCSGSSIWGQAAFTNPTTGTVVSQTYTYTVPSTFNVNQLKVVGMVQKYGTTTIDRPVENAVLSMVNLAPRGTLIATADSFKVYTSNNCSGTEFFISTNSYATGMTVTTFFGDGTSASNSILGTTLLTGYADFTHNYSMPGAYTVKQVLYEGSSAVDSVTYTSNYLLCNMMPVRYFFDANSNCFMDTDENYDFTPNLTEVDSNGLPIDTISAISGFNYLAYGVPGDVYTFRELTVAGGLYVSCPTLRYVTDTLQAGGAAAPVRYFALQCSSTSFYDLAIHVDSRAGMHMASGQILVDNYFCTPENATVTMNISPQYIFNSSTPLPTTTTTNTVTWDFTGLSSTQPTHVIDYTLIIPTTTWLIPGDTIQTFYSITPEAGDVDTTNNNCEHIDTVRLSYDPNEMTVLPSGFILAGTKLQYTISFENTGNATASNIYVMDTLSDNVDLKSLRLLASSAAMNVTYLNWLGHNIVKFDFPNINLLDSTHHNQCDGTVMFNVNAFAGLANGTTILNHAGIFFDDNPVVMTNTVEDIIGIGSGVATVKNAPKAQIFPNPATDELSIITQQGDYKSFSISNLMGQVKLEQEINSTQTTINIQSLPTGVYYITLKGDHGTMVEKLVKW